MADGGTSTTYIRPDDPEIRKEIAETLETTEDDPAVTKAIEDHNTLVPKAQMKAAVQAAAKEAEAAKESTPPADDGSSYPAVEAEDPFTGEKVVFPGGTLGHLTNEEQQDLKNLAERVQLAESGVTADTLNDPAGHVTDTNVQQFGDITGTMMTVAYPDGRVATFTSMVDEDGDGQVTESVQDFRTGEQGTRVIEVDDGQPVEVVSTSGDDVRFGPAPAPGPKPEPAAVDNSDVADALNPAGPTTDAGAALLKEVDELIGRDTTATSPTAPATSAATSSVTSTAPEPGTGSLPTSPTDLTGGTTGLPDLDPTSGATGSPSTPSMPTSPTTTDPTSAAGAAPTAPSGSGTFADTSWSKGGDSGHTETALNEDGTVTRTWFNGDGSVAGSKTFESKQDYETWNSDPGSNLDPPAPTSATSGTAGAADASGQTSGSGSGSDSGTDSTDDDSSDDDTGDDPTNDTDVKPDDGTSDEASAMTDPDADSGGTRMFGDTSGESYTGPGNVDPTNPDDDLGGGDTITGDLSGGPLRAGPETDPDSLPTGVGGEDQFVEALGTVDPVNPDGGLTTSGPLTFDPSLAPGVSPYANPDTGATGGFAGDSAYGQSSDAMTATEPVTAERVESVAKIGSSPYTAEKVAGVAKIGTSPVGSVTEVSVVGSGDSGGIAGVDGPLDTLANTVDGPLDTIANTIDDPLDTIAGDDLPTDSGDGAFTLSEIHFEEPDPTLAETHMFDPGGADLLEGPLADANLDAIDDTVGHLDG